MKRRLLHFVVIGGLLFGTRRALSEDELAPGTLRVEVVDDASDATVRAKVDEAMLLDVALRAGWARTDAVVRDRLIRNMRFAGEEGDDGVLLARAIQLGMARRDPVARRRLIESARSLLIRRGTPAPTAAELEAYRRDHAERFTRPGKVRVHQVFVSAQRRGDRLEERAAEVGARLRDATLSPVAARELSDPILLGTDLGWVDARRLDGSLGGGISQALTDADPQTWIGPARSSFGLHYLWIEAHRAATLPALVAIRAEVAEAWRRDAEARALRTALDRLRTTYAIEVVR